jgi:CRISPR-associated protein Csb2
MPRIELRFPAGRLHATPWGRHVNEGAVEWPPSPWRLLRALVATWYLKSRDDVPEGTLREVVHALAAQFPTFELPKATVAHTRHYMPDNAAYHKEGGQKTFGPGKDKVFDTFIHLAGPLRIHWEVSLSSPQSQALTLLCERLGYFGRAEAVVEAKVLPVDSASAPDAQPLAGSEAVPAGKELLRLLCPESPDSYAKWRAEQLANAPPAPAAKKKTTRKSAKAASVPVLPADIFATLHADTGELQSGGWTLPPGTRLVDYVRPANCFDLAPSRPHKVSGQRPIVARFAVSSAVPPRLTKAVSVAERIHQALLARFPDGQPPAVFTGRGADGRPLTGHRHMHIFCEGNGPRDALTHVTLFACDSFDTDARRAIESLHRVWGHGGHDLQLVLLGFGSADTFSDCPLFTESKVWRSLTPFVPTRHPKTHRDGRPKLDADGWPIGSPAHDLRRLLTEAGLPLPAKIEAMEAIPVGCRRLRPLEFQSQRFHGEGLRGGHSGTAFRLTFSEPVSGPLALGYAAHFSLGLFVPAV